MIDDCISDWRYGAWAISGTYSWRLLGLRCIVTGKTRCFDKNLLKVLNHCHAQNLERLTGMT